MIGDTQLEAAALERGRPHRHVAEAGVRWILRSRRTLGFFCEHPLMTPARFREKNSRNRPYAGTFSDGETQ
jgi:hypothetical protein